jgi:hypothetical protein
MRDKPQAQIVRHPQGGWTLAVPTGNGSTVRIYRGHWTRKPTAKDLTLEAAA